MKIIAKLYIIILFIISCSNQREISDIGQKKEIKKPDILYSEALIDFERQNLNEALNRFRSITKLYPLSNEAIKSEVMIGFIEYSYMNYEKAILQFDKIIRKYPSYKDLDYIYYMRGMCNYEQINNEGLDGKYNVLALNDFNQVISRFPLSEYSRDSSQKIIFIKSNIAAKHMEIGRFYLKEKKYISALGRFKIIINDLSETKFAPEALHRMVEAYYQIGMISEANNTAAVLGYNYPESKWYKYSYDILNEDKDDKKSFFNFF